MPKVYATGDYIPELDGYVHGAVTVVCSSPADLELVYAMAALVPRPPASPLWSLAQAFSATSIAWDDWKLHWQTSGGRIPLLSDRNEGDAKRQDHNEASSEWRLPEETPVETLKQAMAALHALWTAEPDDVSSLTCCVSVALGSEDHPSLEWAGTQPALAFGQGSLWASVALCAWRARGFVAGLLLNRGIDAASRRAGLVKRARDRAIARLNRLGHPNLASLRDIRTLDVVPAAQTLCVLIHGLCSTDVGTFDQLENLIVSRSGKRGNASLAVVGFPHDSMTAGIDTNAEELAQILVRLRARNLRLVCHSRGGLVARRTAAFLRREKDGASAPVSPWIHSCVTFGTPHLGTSVASSPAELTACALSLAHLSRSPSVGSIADILCLAKAKSTWRSVSELRPIEEEQSCLPQLKRHEDDVLFLDDALPLSPFGSAGLGQRRAGDWRMRFIARILGTGDHDLLVPLSSSVPKLRNEDPGERIFDRTHFEYFSRLDWEPPDPPFWNTALGILGLSKGDQ